VGLAVTDKLSPKLVALAREGLLASPRLTPGDRRLFKTSLATMSLKQLNTIRRHQAALLEEIDEAIYNWTTKVRGRK
jgi:hypothetical protein